MTETQNNSPRRTLTNGEKLVTIIRRHLSVVMLARLSPKLSWDAKDNDIAIRGFTFHDSHDGERQYYWDGRQIDRDQIAARAQAELAEFEDLNGAFIPTADELEAAYIDRYGNICPYCGSKKIEWGLSEMIDDGYLQAVECLDCHRTWKDVQVSECNGYVIDD